MLTRRAEVAIGRSLRCDLDGLASNDVELVARADVGSEVEQRRSGLAFIGEADDETTQSGHRRLVMRGANRGAGHEPKGTRGPAMSNRQPAVRVSDQELRALFGNLRLWEQREANQLLEVEIRNGEPNPANKQPAGTRSIMAQLCRMDGLKLTVVAVVHYYRLPNGGPPQLRWAS